MVEYKQGGPLVEAVRAGNWSMNDIIGNPHLADIHVAAILGTLFAREKNDSYYLHSGQILSATTYNKFCLGFVNTPQGKNLQNMLDAKKEDQEIAANDLKDFVAEYVAGTVDDTMMATMIATIMVSKMTTNEIVALTQATHQSGDTLDFSEMREQGYVMVDKHSTGGIGDLVSLVLAPVVVASHPNAVVPMMSGRGLGHTGGTLDKLEAIPGYRVDLEEREIQQIMRTHRVAIFGQTPRLAPLDKKMYDLRNLINCIASNALIVPSILGKKLAEGIDGLVMDTKTGSGAFLSEYAWAKEFAQLMCDVGQGSGLQTTAFITDMNQPLGLYAGNKLEIHAAVEALVRQGSDRLMQVVYRLAKEMGKMVDHPSSESHKGIASRKSHSKLQGDADDPYLMFRNMVKAQGGDPAYIDAIAENITKRERRGTLFDLARQYAANPNEIRKELLYRLQPEGKLYFTPVAAERDGYLAAMDVTAMGESIRALGAGKYASTDVINPDVGVIYLKELGDRVTAGQHLALILHDGKKGKPEEFGSHYTISDEKPVVPNLIKERVVPQ